MRVSTIGFTKKRAYGFFGLLRDSGARRLVDVRLNNVSQLAGFAKRDDLKYFLHEICGIEYAHLPELAPTKEMLAAYRNGTWTGTPTNASSSPSWTNGESRTLWRGAP